MSSARRMFAVRPHEGLELLSFQPATVDEVRRLLPSIPSKSSPLDVLPCTLLKSCADVFAPVIATLADLSLQSGKFPSCYKKAQMLPLLKKPGLETSSPANYRPISNLTRLQGSRAACVNSYASTSSGLCQFQPVSVSLQEGRFHRDTARGSRQRVHGSQRQAGHSPDRPRLVSGVRHSQQRHSDRTATVRVRR